MSRLSLVARVALLATVVVGIALASAMYAAWRTTDRQLTADLDADLTTQLREWNRHVVTFAPADGPGLAATARAWVTEQQDHPSMQVQAVAVAPTGVVVGNRAWDLLAPQPDRATLLARAEAGPHDLRLGAGAAYRVLSRQVTGPGGGLLGTVTIADSAEAVARARTQLAREVLRVGALVMAGTLVLVWGGTRLLTRRLRRLGHVAGAAGAGDLTVRAGDLGGPPEVRHLAAVLDATLDRIQRTVVRQHAFVADASHELRTPLAIVRAQAELLGVEPEAARRREGVRDLVRQVDATRRLVDDLLVIATGDAAPASLVHLQDVDLPSYAEDLRRDLPLLGDRDFVVEIPPGTLRADPGRLDQILRNLVANAVAHTGADGRVEVQFAPDGGRLRISVRDNGSGMTPEVLDRVFDRFARGPRGASPGARVSGSAGLGLPLAQTLVHAHGGSIRLESAPGRGTTAMIDLPGFRPAV
ncbi:MAG: HAMP domain-containing sensor histidine kinase [Dermatophilaceae bacterium]